MVWIDKVPGIRWARLLCLAMVLVPLPALSGSPDSAKVNILFIAVDDLKPTLGCYGDTLAHTPHIDAIAEMGTVFSSNYCQQAVCAPSRASLLTGRYPDQLQVWDLQTQIREFNPGIVTLPEYLRNSGYQTAATGKVFDPRSVDEGRDYPSWSIPYLGPWDARFYDETTGKPAAYFYASAEAKDTIALLEAEAADLGVDAMEYIRDRYFPAHEKADVPVDAYTDGAIANAGIELLDQMAAGDAPFFLAVGFNRPHLPFNAPSEFWDLYDRNDFSLAPFRQKAADSPDIGYHNYEELRSYTGIPANGPIEEGDQLELIHGYYAAVSYIDYLIGMLLERLDELGLRDRTAVVLWGDHGWHLGDHDLWCKHSNFEQATRSPLIISYPGQPNAGANTSAPTEFTDIAPTLCELTELPIPEYFEGESLLPLIKDPAAQIREGSLSQYPRGTRMGYSIRTGRYRYTKWLNENGSLYADELYDYLLDPLETKDFSEDPAYQSRLGYLDSLLSPRIFHPSTQHMLQFNISGLDRQGDTIPLSNASVRFEGSWLQSDTKGQVMMTHTEGEFPIQIEADRYDPVADTIQVTGDTLISLFLGAPDMNVTVHVEHFYTGEGIPDVRLILNDMENSTGIEGSCKFSEKQGIYFLRIEHELFENWIDSIQINGDTSFIFRLNPAYSTVKFSLKEGGNPVGNTAVTLDTLIRQTNSWGIAQFDKIPTRENYTWQVEKDGYLAQSGSFDLLSDTTVTIQLERVLSPSYPAELMSVAIWPNPAGSVIHLVVPGQGPFQILLAMHGGKVIYRNTIHLNHFDLDLNPFPQGLYLLGIETRTGLQFHKIIKY